jgi:hypothetical protein
VLVLVLAGPVVHAHVHHGSGAHASHVVEEGEAVVGWAENGVWCVSHRVGLSGLEFGLGGAG